MEKEPLQLVLFMVWHDNMRLGKATEEEAGTWDRFELLKYEVSVKKICTIFGLIYDTKEDPKGRSDITDDSKTLEAQY